jgi:preprotein translocase subunit SecG
LIVLIQKGKGGGLSGAFGGAMASGILGSKTGDFLTWVTIVLAGVFLFLAVIMAKFYRQEVSGYGVSQPVQQQMPTGQGQTAPVDETRAKPSTADDSDTLGSSGMGQTEMPVTAEQELPSGNTVTDAGGTGEKSDVNLPGN